MIKTVMKNLVALSHNYRGFPGLLLLPRVLTALGARLPPRPPLLKEVEEDHSSSGDQAQPHRSVVVIRLSVCVMISVMTMMISVMTMMMVRLESVGEKVE